ncbi:MAG: poly-beta-1,6-N-acetyl-D-glucosamine biosynthesis protein PgaD [Nitrospiraceae bacterium]|nr:MAG: poly-beta-1,6-N-acetyl-D-glucosamine biosynthesis protein PgaD [Nitrospiraceae bacterium]
MPEIEIRDNPKLRSFFRNITELTFTGFVWGIWAYLLLPLVNIIMWIVGLRIIERSVVEELGYAEMLDLIGKMGWIILVVFLILRLWGLYNYKRFGKRSRRKSSSPVTTEQLAAHFNIPAEQVVSMRSQKEIVWENTCASETS